MSPAISKSDRELRVGVLFNPLSGKNRQDLKNISQTISKYPLTFHRSVQTPQDIYEALFDFASHKVDLVVISGGDGTVQAVLTVLFNHQPFAKQPQPELVVLEAGTTNMIAGDVGVLGDQNKALHRLFQWVQTGSGRVTKIQRPIIRLQVPGHEVKCGMFFGAASISQGIQYYQKNLHNKGLRGFPGICLTLARYLWAACQQTQPCLLQQLQNRVWFERPTAAKRKFSVIICQHTGSVIFRPAPLLGKGKAARCVYSSQVEGQIPAAGPAVHWQEAAGYSKGTT